MASTLENALRLVKPGEMVVSLTEILDKLGDKITAEDRQQLLIAMLSPRREKVQPGDLISSDVLNQILADVDDLHVRIAKLENNGTTPTTLRIIRIEGPTPIRVGSRVTVIGENFSVPGARNNVSVDTAPAMPINNACTPTQLVFDMPDPGIGQTGRKVTLNVINADSQAASLQFQLEPMLIIPTGTLIVRYITPAASSGNLVAGLYDFGFRLIADVDQDAYIQLNASSSAATWDGVLFDPLGTTDYTKPVMLARASGTHFERDFIVRVTAPSAGSTVISVGATEITAGTQVNPAPSQPLNLAIGQPVPVPENRVAVNYLATSSNVTFEGGTAVFTRNTIGRIDFEVLFNNLGTGGGVVTAFTPTFELKSSGTNNWLKGLQTGTEISISGPQGNGTTGLRLTPPNAASNTELLLTISGQPSGGAPVNVTYRVPLRTN